MPRTATTAEAVRFLSKRFFAVTTIASLQLSQQPHKLWTLGSRARVPRRSYHRGSAPGVSSPQPAGEPAHFMTYLRQAARSRPQVDRRREQLEDRGDRVGFFTRHWLDQTSAQLGFFFPDVCTVAREDLDVQPVDGQPDKRPPTAHFRRQLRPSSPRGASETAPQQSTAQTRSWPASEFSFRRPPASRQGVDMRGHAQGPISRTFTFPNPEGLQYAPERIRNKLPGQTAPMFTTCLRGHAARLVDCSPGAAPSSLPSTPTWTAQRGRVRGDGPGGGPLMTCRSRSACPRTSRT